jgi:multiple sugar transport system substrate-binding protein
MSRGKMFSLVLIVVMLSGTFLTGCSSTTTEPATVAPAVVTEAPTKPAAVAPTAAPIQPVEITLWHLEDLDYRVAAYQKLADDFNAQNPDVKVNIEVQSWADGQTKLLAAAQTGTLPDICQGSASMSLTMWETGKLATVDNIVQSIDAKQTYIAKDLRDKFDYWDNHYWAVPVWSQSIMLYYRDDLFKAAGITTLPTTWDELMADAKLLTGNGVYGIGIPGKKAMYTDEVTHAFMHTNGVQIFDEQENVVFNNPQTIETMAYYKELAAYSSPDTLTMDWAEAENNFATGKVAMNMFFGNIIDRVRKDNPSWALDVKSMAVPVRDSGDYQGTETFVIQMMVFSQDPAKAAASQRFLEFMMEPANYIPWLVSMGGGTTFLPITKTGMESPLFTENEVVKNYWASVQAELDASTRAQFYGFDYATPNPAIGPVNGGNIVAESFQKVLLGEMTPEEAAAWGQQEIIAATTK